MKLIDVYVWQSAEPSSCESLHTQHHLWTSGMQTFWPLE